jgi:hypothetical protein
MVCWFVLENSVEPLTLQTADPFSTDIAANKWSPVETLNDTDSSPFSKRNIEGDS